MEEEQDYYYYFRRQLFIYLSHASYSIQIFVIPEFNVTVESTHSKTLNILNVPCYQISFPCVSVEQKFCGQ